MRRSLLVAGCLVLALSPSPVALGAPAAAEVPALVWQECGGGQQCADLVVPLDYADPGGPTITIAVTRLPATGTKRGSIIVNPGGPGVPGGSYPWSIAGQLPPSVGRAYDIVGFDTRGVGDSSEIVCVTWREMRTWTRIDATPDTAAEQHRFARMAASFGPACKKSAGDLLAHMSTRDTARDLETLRTALGDDRLHFIGASYGTYLGAMYADLFPDHVGHLVLDGAIDPRDDQVGLVDGQINGFDNSATRMAAWCAMRRSCPVPGRTAGQVIDRINRLLADLDSRTLPVIGGAPLRQQEAIVGLIAGLYSRDAWSFTLLALANAMEGDGTDLASLGRSFLTTSPPFFSAFLSISCSDSPPPPGRAGVSRWARERAREARVPEIARYLAWSALPCASWPVHVDEPPGPVRAPGAAPILVIGTTHDPATPMAWARALAGQLDSGVLLTRDGDGHTAIGSGSTCVSRAVAAYLLNDVIPEPGTVCT